MIDQLITFYRRMVLDRPAITVTIVALLVAAAAWFAQDFRLDASSDSLVLENDDALEFYRDVRERYGSDEFLIVTYEPNADLFSESSLDTLAALIDDLRAHEHVTEITSILNVPLINSPPMSLTEIQQRGIRALSDPDTDAQLARQEFLTSPLYQKLVINEDGDTTAMLVSMEKNTELDTVIEQRNTLRRKKQEGQLSSAERAELERLNVRHRQLSAQRQEQLDQDIADVRAILERYRDKATIFLGGVPMIASDMIDFVAQDIRVFGIGVAVFLLVLLTIAFRHLRWVALPAIICGTAAVSMVGLLGLMHWPVTIVSSNFISLMLIITLSLVVHLIVRYRELHTAQPDLGQRVLLWETLKSKMAPSLFTAATTVVSFASLSVSNIRPVIDFGLMMVCGVTMAFVLTMIIFPAALARLPAGGGREADTDMTQRATGAFAALVKRHSAPVLVAYLALIIAGGIGITRLSVENRFIDYFKDSTEIHQGMVLIDKELGGTTPLDVIIDAPKDFLEEQEEFADMPPLGGDNADPIASGQSYWWNAFALEEIERIHDELDRLPETGKVLSLATTAKLLRDLNDGDSLNSFFLGLVYRFLPPDIRDILISPYLSEDGNQVRISIRVIDSDPNLQRDALLEKIRNDLIEKHDLQPEQVHLTGLMVLYNNVLQSLVGSQLSTLGVVFAAIGLMFLILFRSLPVALIAITPTAVAAGLILGLMGWLAIPLDIMTITIAAITIGIGVDNAIHYTHRFRTEAANGASPEAAMLTAHSSVGRAMYYTSLIVALGFSILALSNFVPSLYFGLFTGLAMLVALIANLTLLPLLLMRFGAPKAAAAD